MGKRTRWAVVAALVLAASLVGAPAWANGPSQGQLIEETVFEHIVVEDVTQVVDVVVTGVDPGFTPTVTYPAGQADIEAEVAAQLPPGTSFTVTIDVVSELTDTTFDFETSTEVTLSEDADYIGDQNDPSTLLVLQGTVTITTTETTTETQHILETVTITVHISALTPGTVDDCKHGVNGGWRNLTDHNGRPFTNQGDCVSYVGTGGSNLAAG